jgi:hypothetical protein
MSLSASLICLSPAWAGIVAGEQIGVEITPGSVMTDWTGISALSTNVNALDLSSGSTISGVTVELTGSTAGINNLSGSTDPNDITDAPAAVLENGAYSNGGALTLSFSGLDTTATYTLEIYSLGTATTSDTPVIDGVSGSWPSGFTNRNLRRLDTTGAIFDDVSPNGSGVISFEITGANPVMTAAVLTDGSTSATPEPGSLALMISGAGLFGLNRCFRRKRS